MPNLKQDFSKIYDDNVRKIFRFVLLKVSKKEKAEDLTSRTFLKGWEAYKKSKIKNQKSKIENPTAFLYKIARNLVIDYYRKNGRRKVISTDRTEDLVIPDPDHNAESLNQEIALDSEMAQVRLALSKLKSDYQDLIVWRYLDQLSFEKISQIMEKSEGAVRVQLHRALEKLREELKEV